MQIQVKTLWLLYYFKGKELSKNRKRKRESITSKNHRKAAVLKQKTKLFGLKWLSLLYGVAIVET